MTQNAAKSKYRQNETQPKVWINQWCSFPNAFSGIIVHRNRDNGAPLLTLKYRPKYFARVLLRSFDFVFHFENSTTSDKPRTQRKLYSANLRRNPARNIRPLQSSTWTYKTRDLTVICYQFQLCNCSKKMTQNSNNRSSIWRGMIFHISRKYTQCNPDLLAFTQFRIQGYSIH